MSEKVLQSLEGVSETLLMTLYARARESQRPDAMIKDDKADDDPHLRAFRWVRLIPPLAKSSGIFHYRLGVSP